jgi:alpha-galactosidase
MPVGPSALLRHGVYQGAEADAPKGAKVAIYPGAWQEGTDYSAMKPVKETTVALGTVEAELPSMDGPHTVVAKAFIDVPMSGTHEIRAGFEDSSHAVVSLDGKEVYRKEPGKQAVITPVPLEQGKRYPVTITYMKGGSAAFWLKQIDLKGHGDLASCIKDGKFTWFADEQGKWTVRNDVTYWETRMSQNGGSGGPLSATSNGKFIGPEVPFGFVMGTFHDEPVLLIESSIGNRALSFDFRPPSSGKTEEEKANEWCGKEYDLMVEGVNKTLKNLDKIVPNYQGQGYEIAGFVWWQGHKDKDVPKEVYEKHLVNLIQDLRKEFKTPGMPAVVATVGFGGMEMDPGHFMTWEAQMAVGDPKQHPEFAGNVASVDTRPFWRSRGESPTNTGYHYNHNAETYVLTGDALGRAMVALKGGKAEKPTLPPRPGQHPDVQTIFSDAVTGTFNKTGPHYAPEYYREMGQALKPIVMDEMVPGFIEAAFAENSRGNLKGIVTGAKPAKMPLDIRSELDTLMDYYDIAGIPDYAWKPFGPEMRTATWSYFSFDPPEKQDLAKSNRYRKITFPEGMENWFMPEFDPAKAGWKTGKAPFGQMGGKLDRLRPRCSGPLCGCSEIPATLWEKEVLLMRQTFEMPPVKDGHAYRLILGGAGCDRSGEGFAIYVNGKLLTQADGGFFRHTGIRGAYVHDDILPEFKGGKVTIAVINFLRYTYFNNVTFYHGPHPDYRGKPVPPNGHVSLWLEEAELSPATLNAAARKQ